MSLALKGTPWVVLYLGVVLAPLVFAVLGASQPGQGFLTDFSVALGFVGLAMMGLEFALVARFEPVAAPFGQDALLQFHRQIGYTGLAFVLTHVAISAKWDQLTLTSALNAPLLVWFGMAAAIATLILVLTSQWRRQLRLSYEWWHGLHGALAVIAVVGALVHVFLVDYYVDSLWKEILWGLMSGAFVALLIWVRLLKPLAQRRRPWLVEDVSRERGRTTVLSLRPEAGGGLRFAPGQFAWFAIERSPFSITQHPFSFSSSAEQQTAIEIAVKELGDFTSTHVPNLEPGANVFVDGPQGVFSIDLDEGPGFAFIAGGVGITGLLSMLRTMADREDVRPAVLFYANRGWGEVAFRDELELLEGRMDLRIVHVLEQPDDGWRGETGYITSAILHRHLPAAYRRFQYFICGPGPMMDAMEDSLAELGVPPERVHTERFDMV
jgi:predicted ferric reductase